MRGLFENTALPTAPPIGRQYLANAESTSPFSDALSLYTFVFETAMGWLASAPWAIVWPSE